MTTKPRRLPYNRRGDIDYGSLSFDPYEPDVPPDHMLQELPLQEVVHILNGRFTNFGERPDVFVNANARAIRDRDLYLPWEARKPPDWALEVASPSTGWRDIADKRRIYAEIGILEYWRFDSTGGDIYGDLLVGDRLVNGVYQPFELTTEPDGVLKGYSPTLELYLCWDNHMMYIYDPVTEAYLRNVVQLEDALEAAEAELRQLREELRRRDQRG